MNAGFYGRTAPPPGAVLDRSHPLSQGLILWHAGLERSGRLAKDIVTGNVSGQANRHGVLTGNTAYVPWKFGGGAWSIGTSFVNLGSTHGLPIGLNQAYSFSLWAYSNAAQGATLIDNSDGSTGVCWNITLSNANGDFVRYSYNNSQATTAAYDSTYSLTWPLRTWRHILVTDDGLNTSTSVAIYIDGRNQPLGGATAATGGKKTANQATAWGQTTTGGQNQFNGRLANIQIWNRALPAWCAQELCSQPYQQFVPPVWRKIFVPGGAGTSWSKSLTDSYALSEVRALGANKALSDGYSLADLRVSGANKALSETVSLSDALATVHGFIRALSESYSLTDTRASGANKALTENYGLTDSKSTVAGFLKAVSESYSLSDVRVSGAEKALADTYTLSDGVSALLVILKTLSDTFSLSDTRTSGTNKALVETYSLTDSRAVGTLKALTEALGLTDSTARSAGFARALSDSYALADVRVSGANKGLTDSLPLADVLAHILGGSSAAWAQALTETLVFSDARTVRFAKVLAEFLGFTDAFSHAAVLALIYLADSRGTSGLLDWSGGAGEAIRGGGGADYRAATGGGERNGGSIN
jgi:hypothetical protein